MSLHETSSQRVISLGDSIVGLSASTGSTISVVENVADFHHQLLDMLVQQHRELQAMREENIAQWQDMKRQYANFKHDLIGGISSREIHGGLETNSSTTHTESNSGLLPLAESGIESTVYHVRSRKGAAANADPTRSATSIKAIPSVSSTTADRRDENISRKFASELATTLEEKVMIQRLVKHPLFEKISSFVIACDLICLSVQCQWQSYGVGFSIGLRDNDAGWDDAEDIFVVLRIVLCAVYAIELCMRMYVFKVRILLNPIDALDACTIIALFVEICIGQEAGNKHYLVFSVGRIPYLLRGLKILHLISNSAMLADLRILLRTVWRCAHAMMTVVIGLCIVIYASSLCVAALTLLLLTTDETLSAESKRALYDDYGSLLDACYSMFEAALSSAWVLHARFMIYDASPWFALFWCPFVIAVSFLGVRIIAAITVKQVLEIATEDQERMAMARIHNSKIYAGYIHEIFKAGDSSGDGVLNREEFEAMQGQPLVAGYFEKLGLDRDETQVLFDVLSADDGVVDFDEFLSAALKLKNSARTIDAMQIVNLQRKMMLDIRAVRKFIDPSCATTSESNTVERPRD